MEASQLKWAKPAAAIRRPRGSVEQHASTVALETTPAKAHCHATNPTPTSLSSKVLLFPPSVAPRSPVPLHPLASRRVDGRRRTRVMAQTTLQRVADAPAPTRVDKEEDQPQGDGGSPAVMIKGTVVLIKSNVVGFNNFWKSFLDWVDELRGNGVVFQLVSATVGDPDKGNRGKVGKPANLQGWTTTPTSLSAVEYRFNVTFEWEEALGIPGAVIVKNHHNGEFYLESLILEGVPGPNRRLHFDCNSWVYPVRAYNYDRVFFTNDAYLPGDMPEPLKAYRWEELFFLRGDYITRQLQIPDRVYGYAYYNNLGKPDKGPDYVRPVLGGSKEYPYPRRARTGLPPTMSDPNAESRLPLTKSLNVYVPRDERFSDVKLSDFLAWAFKSGTQALVPAAQAYICGWNFQTFGDQMQLYEGSIKLPEFPENIRKLIPFELFRELLRSDGEQLFKLPMPQVIQASKIAWKTDEEFAREMLAGLNPVIIKRLETFPPVSNLDPKIYGDQNSSITAADIEKNLNCLTVHEALENNKLFILDYHDALMPFLSRINSTGSQVYASRTLLLLQDDGTLKPLAIELSLPGDGGHKGAVSKVFTPAEHDIEGAVWQLAKAFVTVDDSGYHQLISHWLNTHAIMEPFAIATNRQLSVVHPIYKLLKPHFRDTIFINAQARQVLISAGGVLESTVFPGKYAMEMSSVVYKSWKLTDFALPTNLLNRGVAVKDPTSPTKVKLLIEDYPYAVDGLAIWSAIQEWVEEYCAIYYPSDKTVKGDAELQAWWKEVREVGHGDLKDETWWPRMDTVADLTHVCTIIIWLASAEHAAVNFGQYPFAGYLPNRPTISRRFMPEPGTKEYAELERNPDGVFLKTVTGELQTVLGVTLVGVLSRHSSEEVYIGQRDSQDWTSDQRALRAFKRFSDRLARIEDRINEMNKEGCLKNRKGLAKVPYTLLYPDTTDLSRVGGLTGRGVPNSISI